MLSGSRVGWHRKPLMQVDDSLNQIRGHLVGQLLKVFTVLRFPRLFGDRTPLLAHVSRYASFFRTTCRTVLKHENSGAVFSITCHISVQSSLH
jgi:hypothetical protein